MVGMGEQRTRYFFGCFERCLQLYPFLVETKVKYSLGIHPAVRSGIILLFSGCGDLGTRMWADIVPKLMLPRLATLLLKACNTNFTFSYHCHLARWWSKNQKATN